MSKSRKLLIAGFSLLILVSIVPFGHPVPIQVNTNHPSSLLDHYQAPSIGVAAVNVAVARNPVVVVYDNGNGYVYVTNIGPSQSAPGIVSVFAGTTIVANVTVGDSPLGAVYDGGNGIVYVANYNSGTLSEISGTSVIGTITVGSFPAGLAYDSGNGLIYLLQGNRLGMTPNNLIAINGTTMVANVTVGIRTSGVVYNPANGNLYVANVGPNVNARGTVLEISGTSIVANITVGIGPVSIAYDGRDGNVYVADAGNNPGSSDLTVISGSSIVRTITVGIGLEGVAFDNGDGQIYVSNIGLAGQFGNGYVLSLNGTMVTGNVTVGSLPGLLAYDNGNGYVYVANGYSNTVSILIQTSAARFDYTISNSGPVTVEPGGNSMVSVTATLSSGVIQPIILSCANPLPSGISCGWIMRGSAGSTQQSKLMISVAPGTPDERVNLTVTGSPLGATTKPSVIGVKVSSSQNSQNILGLDPTLFYTVLGLGLGIAAILSVLAFRKTILAKRAETPRLSDTR